VKELLTNNEALQKAPLLEQDFHQFYRTDFRWHHRLGTLNRILELAGDRLDGRNAHRAKGPFRPSRRPADSLKSTRLGVQRYFVRKVSTRLSESMNAPINALKPRARGYCDLRYFICKI